MVVIARASGFLLKTVLQLQLSMRRKTVGSRNVDPRQVLTPSNTATLSVIYAVKELLVPAERTEELRGEFIFRLNIVCECVGVADRRNLETRLVKFRP